MCSVWYLSLSLLEFNKTELIKIESTSIFKEKWQLTNWNSRVSPEMIIIGGKTLSHSFAIETGLKRFVFPILSLYRYNRLFENVNTLRGQNMQLTISNENLRRESGNRSPGIGPSISSAHEARLLKQTEELTALHRKNGEHMQQIVDLNKKMQEMIEELHAKDASLAESMETNTALHLEITKYVNREREYESINQMLKDEHQALQLAFASLEDKLRKSQEENRQLVERLIKYKARDAEKMNEENDNFLKKRQAKMQKELEDAARDTRPVSPDRSSLKEGVAGLPTTVPTKVSVTFNAHEGEVYAVKWSPVDRILATGGADRKVKLWSIIKGTSESKGVLVGSNAGVMSVDFDSTGTLILGASNDFASRVWTVSDLRVKTFIDEKEKKSSTDNALSVGLRSSVTFVFLWRVNVLAMGQDND
ncbi:autophagy-related protein 16-1 isoform X1 [Vespula maculifrons]|uniref:Autophagy-related protein 16-1 isoform X1 n=1 Tax=Vespula maculifrons TaxID=7453 RepID=A0ABD2CS57_VESMC